MKNLQPIKVPTDKEIVQLWRETRVILAKVEAEQEKIRRELLSM